MFKKSKYVIIILLSFCIIGYGLIKVNIELPEYIRDRSAVKITYNSNPFDLRFDIGNYIIYINGKMFGNIKQKTSKAFEKLGSNNPIKEMVDGTRVK